MVLLHFVEVPKVSKQKDTVKFQQVGGILIPTKSTYVVQGVPSEGSIQGLRHDLLDFVAGWQVNGMLEGSFISVLDISYLSEYTINIFFVFWIFV